MNPTATPGSHQGCFLLPPSKASTLLFSPCYPSPISPNTMVGQEGSEKQHGPVAQAPRPSVDRLPDGMPFCFSAAIGQKRDSLIPPVGSGEKIQERAYGVLSTYIVVQTPAGKSLPQLGPVMRRAELPGQIVVRGQDSTAQARSCQCNIDVVGQGAGISERPLAASAPSHRHRPNSPL